VFGSHEKITKGENATVALIQKRPVAIAEFRRRQYSCGRMLSDFGAAWIPTTDHC